MPLRVDLSILNQKGTPAFYSDTFANRPSAGFAGRVFISTDTGAIYEDTGSAWTLIADAGAGTTGTLQQVTTNGNTTTNGLVVTSGNVAIGTATAGAPLDIHCTGTAAQFNGTGTNNAYVYFQNAGANKWRVGNLYNAGANSLEFVDAARTTNVMSLRSTGTYQEVYVNGYNTISNIANFSSAGNYAINPSLTLSIPSTTTFNSGASWSGMATSLLNTWGANNTIDQGAVMSGFIGVNRQSFNTAGVSITVTQGSNGARAICGMQVLSQTGGSINGTISHGASLLVQGVYPSGSANVTYTNYYGLLLNQLDEFGTVTFTNRWGIYQGGASDKNYFNGNMLIKSTTDNGSALQVTGTSYFSQSASFNGVSTGVIAYFNAPTNGGTITFQTGGTSFADIGSELGNFGTGSSTNLCVSARSGKDLILGGGALKTLTLASTGYASLSGNLIIGSATNTNELNIYASLQPTIKFQNSGADRARIYANNGNTTYNSLTGNGHDFQIDGTSYLRVWSTTGNVGIGGTSDAGNKLQVNGSVLIKGLSYIGDTGSSSNAVAQFQNSANSYQFGFSSTGTQRFVFINGGPTEIANINGATGVYTPLSDINKKKDFEDSTIGLNAILGLKPTLYRMKSEDNTQKHLGFIAQQVKEFIPEAYVESNDFIGLNDRPIIAALVKAIQELNEKLQRNNIN